MSLFYSAGLGNAIPDSAVLRYPTDEGGGSTLADSIGSNDADLLSTSGNTADYTWVSDASFVGGFKVDLTPDGYVRSQNAVTTIQTGNDFSVGITIDVDASGITGDSEGVIWMSADGTTSDAFGLSYDGTFVFSRWDGSTYVNKQEVSEPTPPYTIRLYATWDSSASSASLYKNGAAGASSTNSQGWIYANDVADLVIGETDRFDGSSGRQAGFGFDSPIVENEIGDPQSDYNRQPWS